MTKLLDYDFSDSTLTMGVFATIIALTDSVANGEFLLATFSMCLLIMWLHILSNRKPKHKQPVYIHHD